MKKVVVVILAVITLLALPRGSRPQARPRGASPCLTSGSGAQGAVTSLRSILFAFDSAGAESDGFPFRPANVAVLGDSLQCVRVIRAYNALFPSSDSVRRIAQGYVAKAWPPAAYALHFPAGLGDMDETFLFDSSYTYKERFAGLK